MKYIIKPIFRAVFVLLCYCLYPLIQCCRLFCIIWDFNDNWYKDNLKSKYFIESVDGGYFYKTGIDFIMDRKSNY